VLGWEQWREIDLKYGFGLMHGALEAAMEAGLIERQPVRALAHLLLGALDEAALLVARADDHGRRGARSATHSHGISTHYEGRAEDERAPSNAGHADAKLPTPVTP